MIAVTRFVPRGLLLILAGAAFWCCRGATPAAAEPAAPAPVAKDIFFFIPHTHWEGAVFKTREEYLDVGLPNILLAHAVAENLSQLPLRPRSGLLR